MRHHDDCQPLLAVEGAEELHDLSAGVFVEVAGRLVGEQDARAIEQGPRDRRPLHLAAGEFARLVGEPVAEADAVQYARRPFAQLAPPAPPADDRLLDHARNKDIFQRVEFGQQVIKLKNKAEGAVAQVVALATGQVVDAMAVQADIAVVGPVERAE